MRDSYCKSRVNPMPRRGSALEQTIQAPLQHAPAVRATSSRKLRKCGKLATHMNIGLE